MKTQMNKIHIFSLMSLMASLLSCSHSNTELSENVESTTLELTDEVAEVSADDEFYDFEIISLDNNKDGLLSDCMKMVVTDSGMLFFNDPADPSVLYFDNKGHFKNKIGEKGRKKSEYISITNFSATDKGDTITLLEYNTIKRFRSDGTFISSQTIDGEYGWDDLLMVKDGMMMGTYHRGYDHLLTMYNWKDKETRSFFPTNSEILKGSVWTINGLQKAGNKVCFLDMFSSTFYIIDLNHPEEMRSISLSSPQMLTEEVARTKKDYLNMNYDFVSDFTFSGDVILGSMHYKESSYDFRIDLKKNEFTFLDHIGFNYNNLYYHNGYFYKVITQNRMIEYLNVKFPYMKETKKIIEKAFKSDSIHVTELDNYYILKMKRRNEL